MSSMPGFARFSLDRYRRIVASGIFEGKEPVELLDGFIVLKMPEAPLHDEVRDRLHKAFQALGIPAERNRSPALVAFAHSELEVDLVLFTPAGEIALLIEVSGITRAQDRHDKAAVYAQAGVPVLGIVNLIDRQLEWYREPTAEEQHFFYRDCQVFVPGMSVQVEAAGHTLGSLSVQDFLP